MLIHLKCDACFFLFFLSFFQHSSDDADTSCSKNVILARIKVLEKENMKFSRENSQLRKTFGLFHSKHRGVSRDFSLQYLRGC